MSAELKEMVASASVDDEIKCVALGAEDTSDDVAQVIPTPESANVEDRVAAMEERLLYITNAIDSLFQIVKGLRDKAGKDHDAQVVKTIEKKKKEQKIEIPEDTILEATSRGLSYFCTVKSDGFYIGETRHESLSAAAQAVSGVRRSGWTFWKLPDGKTVKEVYKS